jgi:hypothetical protein
VRRLETYRGFRERRVWRVRVRGRVDARRRGREGLTDHRGGRDERGRGHEVTRLVPSLPRAFRRASRRTFRRARGRGSEVGKRREAGSPEGRRRVSLVAVDLRTGRAGNAQRRGERIGAGAHRGRVRGGSIARVARVNASPRVVSEVVAFARERRVPSHQPLGSRNGETRRASAVIGGEDDSCRDSCRD